MPLANMSATGKTNPTRRPYYRSLSSRGAPIGCVIGCRRGSSGDRRTGSQPAQLNGLHARARGVFLLKHSNASLPAIKAELPSPTEKSCAYRPSRLAVFQPRKFNCPSTRYISHRRVRFVEFDFLLQRRDQPFAFLRCRQFQGAPGCVGCERVTSVLRASRRQCP